jgi:hypothetical protein
MTFMQLVVFNLVMMTIGGVLVYGITHGKRHKTNNE